MTKFIAIAALAAAMSVVAVADASAWTRSGTVTGPRGTSTIQGSGSCANGTCSRSVTRTGPYGYSATKQSSASCAGGTCSRSATRTGPYGYSVTKQGSASCANGVCSGSSQTTGPYGGTVYRQGSISR